MTNRRQALGISGLFFAAFFNGEPSILAGVAGEAGVVEPAQARDVVFAYSVRSPRGQALELASARP